MAVRLLLFFLLFFLLIVPAIPKAAECTASSGAGTAALVELYTSEGCSSCPPAERWLASLDSRYPAGKIVALALHVDYWDYIGWKDPYAKREFSLRQRKLSQLQRMALVYAPQVLLQGREFRGWGGKAFDAALAKINAQPARANLKLAVTRAAPGALEVEAVAALHGSAEADLYLAAYRSGLQSQVKAGENRGRLLSHDYVVLEWQGPFALAGKTLTERRKVPLLPGAAPANSGVAAFVQDRRTGEVLQALLRSAC
jgi:hypothetical protein